MGPQHNSNKHNPNQGVVGGRDEAAHELSHCWTVPHTWNQGTSGTSGSSATNSGAESSADELSGRSQITRSYSFPRPPGSTAGRSSVAGYHTPAGTGARSVISSTASNHPPFSSAGSVISESDAASSVKTPNSSLSRKGTNSGASRRRRDGGGIGVPRGIERVDEHDREWSARGEGYPTTSSSNVSVSGMGSYQQYQLAPLKVPVNFTRPGGFLMLDDVVDDEHSFTPPAASRSEKERTRHGREEWGAGREGREGRGGRGGPGSVAGTFGRPNLSRNGSETESVAPVIRDFDDLDMMDDHRM